MFNKSSLFFGSIMAVFLHQIHLNEEEEEEKMKMRIPLISLKQRYIQSM